MKILYIDVALTGHHVPYLRGLLDDKDNKDDKVLLIPATKENFGVRTYNYKQEYDYRKINDYLHWIGEVKRIVEKENPEIIHFVYGDVFYRHFSLGLNYFYKNKVIITFHQFRRNPIIDVSLKMIFRKIYCGVVHTSYNTNELNGIGIYNVVHIEYPQLYDIALKELNEAKVKLGLKTGIPVLTVLGETTAYKGLDVLLKALSSVDKPFQLLVAGKEGDHNRKFIINNTKEYADEVKMILRYLSDEELVLCISASDYIMLPYKKRFNGASGPLAEAVWACKNVIASDHGSLGDIVRNNHLGITFESGNAEALSKAIIDALGEGARWDSVAQNYREKINIKSFRKLYRKLYNQGRKNDK